MTEEAHPGSDKQLPVSKAGNNYQNNPEPQDKPMKN